MIVRYISKNEFLDAFNIRKGNFSDNGLMALYDYLDDFYSEADKPYELDVIEICCSFTEYDNLQDFNKDYNREYENIDEIVDDTEIIRIDDKRFIIANF